MYANSRHQEVLVMTNTSFSSQEWFMKNEFRTNRLLSKRQQLIHACWNGMAPKILPECFDVSFDKPMILWGINNGNTFIDLEFGDFIQVLDKTSSVNPYVFMQVQEYS